MREEWREWRPGRVELAECDLGWSVTIAREGTYWFGSAAERSEWLEMRDGNFRSVAERARTLTF